MEKATRAQLYKAIIRSMMDQFVLDLTREWKALGLPLNPRLGGCQPASCAYCRWFIPLKVWSKTQTSGNQQSLLGWQLESAPWLRLGESVLLSKKPRPQPSKPQPSFAGTSRQTMWKCWFISLYWLSTTQMSYSVTNSDINPNSRGEQGGGLEKKTSQTFAPRLYFFELWTFWCRLHQRLFSWRIETISMDWIWRIQNCWIPVSKT